jgi:hypothetical protein
MKSQDAPLLDDSSPDPPREACPWLPTVTERLDPSITRRHGNQRGSGFYHDALAYAQSHWLVGKPAQALLQLNKAWMADLDPNDPILQHLPPPYQALTWILQHSANGSRGFLGNPVRHFQHLASRMSGPRREVRVWRAWACHHLAAASLDGRNFPRDGHQIAREGLWIPSRCRALNELAIRGWRGEATAAQQAFDAVSRGGHCFLPVP